MALQPSFIMILETKGQTVYSTRPYQSIALNDYIDNHLKGRVLYTDKNDSNIKFYISEFNKSGLSGNYDDVYSLIREDGTDSPISRNKIKLQNLSTYINRIIDYDVSSFMVHN